MTMAGKDTASPPKRVTMIRRLAVAAVCICSLNAHAQTFSERVAARLRQSVFATSPPGDASRLFITEKATGEIKILDLSTQEILPEPFLDVPNLATQSEAGLLGLAFHPDYDENGKFYVYASQNGGSRDHRSQIFEYSVDGDPATSNAALADSQKSILRFDQPFGNHNGGWIGFDPTSTGTDRNLLYIATGDGGSGGDPENNSQDITDNLLGKMLRVDVTGDDFVDDEIQNYSIPANNPFLAQDGDDEIFAYGLRNPWRSSFDRQTGDLWIADVGQSEREEIDFIASGSEGGQNFGWRVMEGNDCFQSGNSRDNNLACDDPSFTPPIYEYTHGFGEFQGRSVTGGYVYRGPVKEFQGHYMFADFVSDNVWSMNPHTLEVTNQNFALEPPTGALSSIASFAEDGAGNLYIVNLGSIYRIDSTSRDAIWAGDDATSGSAGDGEAWDDANNWVRDGNVDTAFVSGDHLVLQSGSLSSPLRQRVSAVTFTGDASLTLADRMENVSGNIFVESGIARILGEESHLTGDGDAEGIQKLGPGWLETDQAGRFTILDGVGTFLRGGDDVSVKVKELGTLRQFGDDEEFTLSSLIVDDGTVELHASVPSVEATLRQMAVLRVAGEIELSGNLVVHLPADYQLPAAGKFENLPLLVHGDERVGDFDAVFVGDARAGHQGDGEFLRFVWQNENNVAGALDKVLFLQAYQALPGDADGDGEVGFLDFLQLANAFGGEGGWVAGEFTGDGIVGFEDFLELANNFGQSATEVIVAPVPEPDSAFQFAIIAFGLGVIVRRRCR